MGSGGDASVLQNLLQCSKKTLAAFALEDQKHDLLVPVTAFDDNRLGVYLRHRVRVVKVDVEPHAVVIRVGHGAGPTATSLGAMGVVAVFCMS